MKSIVFLVIGLLLGVGMTLLVLRGTPPAVADCPGLPGAPCGTGDANASGTIDIADAIYLLTYLFAKGPVPEAIVSPACDSCCPPAPPSGLPATGQTLCYDTVENVIDCASADYPGQDGFYGKGCPTADRYVDNQDGTVTDTCTGLMWQKETADKDGNGTIDSADTMQWQNALQYCESLEFAGHSDWRLPNVRELQSIVDYGRMEPSSDPIFGEESGWYWSSSTHVHLPNGAWYVYFFYGHVYDDDKTYMCYVRAVRG
jgi:hypothetical protein